MIKTLRRKFVLIMMALVSVVLLAVLAGICLYYAGTLRQEGTRALELMLDRPHGGRMPNFELGGKVPEGFGRDPVFLVTVNADGVVSLDFAEWIDVDEADLTDIVAQVMAAGDEQGVLSDYDLRYMVRARGGQTSIALMALSLEKGQLRNVFVTAALAVAGALVVFFVASVLLARWVLRPVETAWQRQRRFVADASHELKTPLTVILANTGILKSHPEETVAAQLGWVDNTEKEARRMKGLVDDLLFLAKSDDAAGQVPMAEVDLSEAIETAALSFESVAFEQGLSLELTVEPGIRVQGNEPQLKQLAGILLDNAVKYGARGSAVRLRLRRRQGQAELSVFNAGAAISEEQQRHIFERFYRADPSRAEGGYGLGLSIARAIAEGHRGRIAVESGEGGTTFTVSLPVK